MADTALPNRSVLRHWELDDQLAEELAAQGRSIWVVNRDARPRWVADGLEDVYGPNAPHQPPNPMNNPQDTGR